MCLYSYLTMSAKLCSASPDLMQFYSIDRVLVFSAGGTSRTFMRAKSSPSRNSLVTVHISSSFNQSSSSLDRPGDSSWVYEPWMSSIESKNTF